MGSEGIKALKKSLEPQPSSSCFHTKASQRPVALFPGKTLSTKIICTLSLLEIFVLTLSGGLVIVGNLILTGWVLFMSKISCS